MSRKKRDDLKGVAVVAKVNCLGERHRIGLSNSGRLILFDHEKGDEDEVSAMLLFNPELRCRCHEIRDAWRWYTRDQGSPRWYEIHEKEEFSWVNQAFTDSYGRFSSPTESRLLAHIPSALRDHAREGKKRAYDRRWTKKGRVWSDSLSFPATDFYKTTYTRREHKGEFLERSMQRSLGRAGIRGLPVKPEKIDGLGYRLLPKMQHYRKHADWFQACEKAGCIPIKLPPEGLWKNGYPPTLQAIALNGHQEWRGKFESELHWVVLTRCEKTRTFKIDYVREKGQCK